MCGRPSSRFRKIRPICQLHAQSNLGYSLGIYFLPPCGCEKLWALCAVLWLRVGFMFISH